MSEKLQVAVAGIGRMGKHFQAPQLFQIALGVAVF